MYVYELIYSSSSAAAGREGLHQLGTFHLSEAARPPPWAFRASPRGTSRALGKQTWYMMEDGGGSMHGCWSGRGSSSSRSTLDRASSRVTWVVMAAVAPSCADGEGRQGPPRVSQPPPGGAPSREERGFTLTETTCTRSFFTKCLQLMPDS